MPLALIYRTSCLKQDIGTAERLCPAVSMCKSDLSNPACASPSVHCLCSVDLGQEDLVVLNLSSGIAAVAAAVIDAAPLCD